jgi:hypothetical protein
VGVFVDVSRDGSSLGVIGSRVEVPDKMDDEVTPVRSSACAAGSDNSGSGLVKPNEAGPSKEIGQLDITLSGVCSRISAKKRVVAN